MLGSIQSLGLVSGIDSAGLIDKLGSIERRSAQVLKQQQQYYSARLSAFGVLRSRLADIQDAAAAIDGLDSSYTKAATDEEFLDYSATSSDDTKVAVTGSSADTGVYEVEVTAVAQSNRLRHAGVADATAALSTTDEILVLEAGGQRLQIDIAANVTTLQDVRDVINNSALDVKAKIVDDPNAAAGQRYQLQIEATRKGVANAVQVHADTTLAGFAPTSFTEKRAAADAAILFDGDSYTSSDGQFTGLIDGVTIEAKQKTNGSPVEVEIARDTNATIGKVREFVDAVNGLLSFVGDQMRYDPDKGTAGVLSGAALARSVVARVREAIARPVSGATGAYRALAEIGFKTERNGQITLDEDALRKALDADPDGVRRLFVGEGEIEGVAARLSRSLESTLDDTNGPLKIREEANQDRIDALQERIDRINEQADRYQERLFRQFQALESTMAQLQQLQSFVATNLNVVG
ncbi:MAG: hypothetical protein D6776_04400 [Planctomycetota bacterium]|nr:MAG: hypothetical protein D6776_04400 [Planctomycetota bacterium]